MHPLDLVCPECRQLGACSRDVWVPENPSYRVICRFCRMPSPLEMWSIKLHPNTAALLKHCAIATTPSPRPIGTWRRPAPLRESLH